MKSDLAGFYKLSIEERRRLVFEQTGVAFAEDERTQKAIDSGGFTEKIADNFVENVIGIFGLPLGIATNFHINGRDLLIPMAIEESSVIAAASHAAKLLKAGGGLTAVTTRPVMIGQIQLLDVPDIEKAKRAILSAKEELIEEGKKLTPLLVDLGGGLFNLKCRILQPLTKNDPLGTMLIIHLLVDVRDAMGANTVNTICEGLAPKLAQLSGGRARLRILSNLADQRLVEVRGQVPFSAFCRKGEPESFGKETAQGIEEASIFAERDPYRAATHNKGIMNGIDAVLMATGQDYRAVEAGVHAYAARSGRYRALSRWRVGKKVLRGTMRLPLALGIVGGITRSHPTVKRALEMLKIRNAHELAEIAAAVGLAQNLAALRALAMEGIQQGHMALHAKNIAIEVGATGEWISLVAQKMIESRQIDHQNARKILAELITQKKSS